jgi:hypothetical protein
MHCRSCPQSCLDEWFCSSVSGHFWGTASVEILASPSLIGANFIDQLSIPSIYMINISKEPCCILSILLLVNKRFKLTLCDNAAQNLTSLLLYVSLLAPNLSTVHETIYCGFLWFCPFKEVVFISVLRISSIAVAWKCGNFQFVFECDMDRQFWLTHKGPSGGFQTLSFTVFY